MLIDAQLMLVLNWTAHRELMEHINAQTFWLVEENQLCPTVINWLLSLYYSNGVKPKNGLARTNYCAGTIIVDMISNLSTKTSASDQRRNQCCPWFHDFPWSVDNWLVFIPFCSSIRILNKNRFQSERFVTW